MILERFNWGRSPSLRDGNAQFLNINFYVSIGAEAPHCATLEDFFPRVWNDIEFQLGPKPLIARHLPTGLYRASSCGSFNWGRSPSLRDSDNAEQSSNKVFVSIGAEAPHCATVSCPALRSSSRSCFNWGRSPSLRDDDNPLSENR